MVAACARVATLIPVHVHLNGRVLPASEARISPFDRGFLFGDALYEGLRAFDGRIVGPEQHVRRLARGLEEIRLDWDARGLTELSLELLRTNELTNAFIYWQVSRGTPGVGRPVRSRLAPAGTRPTVFGYCVPAASLAECARTIPTKTAVTVADGRWARCHVKSTSLLGAILASMEAEQHGVDDSIFIRDGRVAEGTSANLFAALPAPGEPGGVEVVTPSLESAPMLAGVTRELVLQRAARGGVKIRERALGADELAGAREVMLCGTLTMITAVTRLDGRVLNDGAPGPACRRLHELLVEAIRDGA